MSKSNSKNQSVGKKMRTVKGKINGHGNRVCIVISKFNDFITKRLLDGCLKELVRCGVEDKDVTVAWVPGAFEIPVAASKLAKKKNVDAVICLGAVIRGETKHFDLVAERTAQGIMQVSLMTSKPVIFGVLAADTVDLAYRRSEEEGDNKGKDAALTAVEMIDVLSQISKSKN